MQIANELVEFLVKVCGLPKCVSSQSFGPRTSVVWCFRENYGVRDDKGIYLTAAGGIKSLEAEVVSDALIDAGVYDVATLVKLVSGNPDALHAIPGIQVAAVMYIIEGCEGLARKNLNMSLSDLEDKPIKEANKLIEDLCKY